MCDTTAILFYSISIFYFIKLYYIISYFLLEGFLKNVGTPCVTMDFNTQLWSNFGCFWGTHMTSETSICTHSLGLSGNRVAVNPLMNQHFLCPTAMMGIWYNLFSDTQCIDWVWNYLSWQHGSQFHLQLAIYNGNIMRIHTCVLDRFIFGIHSIGVVIVGVGV